METAQNTNPTPYDIAFELWLAMTPMQRLEVIKQTPKTKSQATMFRNCINHVIKNLADYQKA